MNMEKIRKDNTKSKDTQQIVRKIHENTRIENYINQKRQLKK